MPSRILVIEDEPANIQTLSTLLKERGYQINIATNGGQALQVLERIRPDLILLDIMMPEMDGFETCRRIKGSTAWREIRSSFSPQKPIRQKSCAALSWAPWITAPNRSTRTDCWRRWTTISTPHTPPGRND